MLRGTAAFVAANGRSYSACAPAIPVGAAVGGDRRIAAVGCSEALRRLSRPTAAPTGRALPPSLQEPPLAATGVSQRWDVARHRGVCRGQRPLLQGVRSRYPCRSRRWRRPACRSGGMFRGTAAFVAANGRSYRACAPAIPAGAAVGGDRRVAAVGCSEALRRLSRPTAAPTGRALPLPL